MNLIEKYQAGSTFEGIRQNYGRLKKISFDYEVVEKARYVAQVGGVDKLLYQGRKVTDRIAVNLLIGNWGKLP